MKAMILAAGRGERMRPLTLTTPKPLLQVGGKPLIEYHLERLAAVGIGEVVINIAYLSEQIREALGDGQRWSLRIHYSPEPEPLETAGALLHALPLLGDKPFMLLNGDIWTDFDFAALANVGLNDDSLGHLVLVDNPAHNAKGDFSLDGDRLILAGDKADELNKEPQKSTYTFSGISLLHPRLIRDYPQQRPRFPLVEVFHHAIAQRQLQGSHYDGEWWDIGTVERLQDLDRQLTGDSEHR